MPTDAPLAFAPEPAKSDAPAADMPEWRILVADDDEDVHRATDLALRNVRILGRSVVVDHAMTGGEVIALMSAAGDEYYAAILLDVVMESTNAGLETVVKLRTDLRIRATRIILRTGQPGHAPDIEAVSNYEIDDYRTKSELNRNRLITTLTAAVRGFRQYVAVEEGRRGLEKIVEASGHLVEVRGLHNFADGALQQIASLMNLPPDGIVCAEQVLPKRGDPSEVTVIGAAGRFAQTMGQALDTLPERVQRGIERSFATSTHIFEPDYSVLYLGHGERRRAVYLAASQPLGARNVQLLAVLATNLSAGLQNAALFAELEVAANYCSLTGLPNRHRFVKLVDELRAARLSVTVALIDLRDFSSISQGLGFEVADSLLKEVANRLVGQFRHRSCHVARLGADVFAIVAPGDSIRSDEVLRCFQAPINIDIHEIHVDVAIGLDTADDRTQHASSDIVRRAEIALDHAKVERRVRSRTYSDQMGERVRSDLALIRDMRTAFLKAEFEVWYQPQFDFKTDKAIGAEALLRWRKPDGSFVSPLHFVPLAEKTGLIRELGHWVLQRALADFARLPGTPRISINISPAEVRDGDFGTRVVHAIERAGIPASRVTLEITESSFISREDAIMSQFHLLREAGVRLAVDDFGTGHASFEYLRWLDVDEVKLDRAFVSEITAHKGSAICNAIIALAHRLGIETVAEGVETDAQCDKLREAGCAIAQGYKYAKPMPLDALTTFWSTQQ